MFQTQIHGNTSRENAAPALHGSIWNRPDRMPQQRMTISKACRGAVMGAILLATQFGAVSAEGPEWNDAMQAAQRALNESRYAEAEQLLKRALMIREAALGATHAGVAASLSNLVTFYNSQRKPVEA